MLPAVLQLFLMANPVTASVETQRFAWGATACDGLALGLEATPQVTGHRSLIYRVAIANRSAQRKRVVLFATLDGIYRTRVVLRTGAAEKVGPAVSVAEPVSSSYTIAVTLAPGEVHVRDGIPLELDAEPTSASQLQLVWGGTPAAKCELRSGTVNLTPRR